MVFENGLQCKDELDVLIKSGVAYRDGGVIRNSSNKRIMDLLKDSPKNSIKSYIISSLVIPFTYELIKNYVNKENISTTTDNIVSLDNYKTNKGDKYEQQYK